VALGLLALLRVTGALGGVWEGPLTLLVIGFAIIIVGVYVAMMARKRYPPAA